MLLDDAAGLWSTFVTTFTIIAGVVSRFTAGDCTRLLSRRLTPVDPLVATAVAVVAVAAVPGHTGPRTSCRMTGSRKAAAAAAAAVDGVIKSILRVPVGLSEQRYNGC